MFEPLPSQFSFPEAEKRILAFWEEHNIFQKSLDQRQGATRFVFYEGPPTANGLPHPGHCLTRAIKDLFPRYQTMCGRLVERKAGWDTHGLPVEVEVCKELGIHTKQEIEAYGVEKFVRKCIESVFRYTREWEQMTRRLGFWVNLEEAYVTYQQSYVESVWWSLKTLFDRGLLYQGHKVVWWWAQGGTALSAGEVGEGYRTVRDPSVYIRFPLVAAQGSRDQGIEGSRGATAVSAVRPEPDIPGKTLIPAGKRVSLLVWTTTPWTLISNHFAAVGPDVDYSLVHDTTTDEYFHVATALVNPTAEKAKHKLETVATCKGRNLVGLRYTPPFDCYAATIASQTAQLKDGGETPSPSQGEGRGEGQGVDFVAWRVLSADFIDLETGTGIVHIAPAYGEVDFNLLQDERQRFVDELNSIPLINAVAPDGTFTEEAPPAYRGRWVKDCDKEIMQELKGRGVLLHQETIEHEYPFCPRAEDDPLIQYARKSWFVRTSQFKDEFLANNDKINWLPEHIQEGRFGDFLRNNVDWALSRERYWGTPLPIWVCEQTGKMEAIGSLAELTAKPGATDATPEYPQGMWAAKKAEDPSIPDHLRVHKPYIDAWVYDSPFAAGAKMRRVPEVIDCWWDAGSMPFAQWGFPHAPKSTQTFTGRSPADFISEAIDQTRGWFYGMLAISTLMFPESTYPRPYRTCIVLGHVMGEDGLKMSKRTKNYKEPSYIFDAYGADAMRWFFFSAQPPWTSVRFQEANIRDAQREFLVRLYHVFSFFNIYANIDGFQARHEGTQARRHEDGDAAQSKIQNPKSKIAAAGWRPPPQRSELDRWIISELNRTVRDVRAGLDRFENFPAAGRIKDFVDALSNWYVRRSRERFWRPIQGSAVRVQGSELSGQGSGFGVQGSGPAAAGAAADQEKWDAYNTLYECLLTLSKLIAPFTPFFAETMYQNLTGQATGGSDPARESVPEPRHLNPEPRTLNPLSVHLCDYPQADEALIDESLAQEMDLVRDIVSLGRAARTAAKLKVRQPLALAEIILTRREQAGWLETHSELIAEELNIKRIELAADAEQYVTYQVKADFKAIGPKFGKLAPQVAAALAKLEPAAARKTLTETGRLTIDLAGGPVTLTEQEVEIRLEAKPGWSAAQGRGGVVVVKTELSDELRDEGLCRELIHQVQALRKVLDLPYEARVHLYAQADERVLDVLRRFAHVVESECLAATISMQMPPAGAEIWTGKVEGHEATLGIVRA